MVFRRAPVVAGTFYEDDAEQLTASIEALFLGPLGPGKLPHAAPFVTRDVVALVSPHAGFQFSGYASASAYLELAEDGIPDTAVIIGPNHHGVGSPVAVADEGVWETPLGDVNVDEEIAGAVLSLSEYASHDPAAHRMEHSLEVQLPLLHYTTGGRTKIVPITISALTPDDARRLVADLGEAIAAALAGKNAVVIASTDFTHYEPQSTAQEKDQLAIRAIEDLDAEKLVDVVEQYTITMCGAIPTAVTIAVACKLGAKKAELLNYYTSGDILGDPRQVVGYAAMKMVKSG